MKIKAIAKFKCTLHNTVALGGDSAVSEHHIYMPPVYCPLFKEKICVKSLKSTKPLTLLVGPRVINSDTAVRITGGKWSVTQGHSPPGCLVNLWYSY